MLRVIAALLLSAGALLAAACGPRFTYESVATADTAAAGTPGHAGPQVVAPDAVGHNDATAPKEDPPPESVADFEVDPSNPSDNPGGAIAADAEPGGCDWQHHMDRAREGRSAQWIIKDTGVWGRAEVPGDRIWIAPRTPCDKVYSVAVHEWTHHMQGVVYGNWRTVVRELAPYGGPETVADCGALLLGATWVHYGCPTRLSLDAATAILLGQRPAAPVQPGP